jgi:tRNA (guanine-N7-)-methyltransferase
MLKKTLEDLHFYGRRRSRRMHNHRQTQFDAVAERFFIPAPTENDTSIDPRSFFTTEQKLDDVWLEIGFGHGEHIINQAQLNPQIGLVGIEPFINGIASAAIAIQEKSIENIRIYPDDAMQMINRFPAASFSRIFLFFPDPWPKVRHHKRRFIQTETVAMLARLLPEGGTLHLATDIPDLADWMIMHVLENPQFTWTAERQSDWTTPPQNWVTTKYQHKAIREGRSSVYLDFVKTSAADAKDITV